MKTYGISLAVLLTAAGCRTASDSPEAPVGYVGVDKIEILAKGME